MAHSGWLSWIICYHIIFQQNLTGQVGQCNLLHVYIIIQIQPELQRPK